MHKYIVDLSLKYNVYTNSFLMIKFIIILIIYNFNCKKCLFSGYTKRAHRSQSKIESLILGTRKRVNESFSDSLRGRSHLAINPALLL